MEWWNIDLKQTEHRTSNNDVAALRNLISFVLKSRSQSLNDYFCFFIFSHSTFDVGRSMFDVHFLPKSTDALIFSPLIGI